MRFLNRYSLIKESQSFNYNKLISEIRYTKGWKELKNPSETYPNTIFAAEYLIEKGYKILLLIRKNDDIINTPFYLKNEILNELRWLDSLASPVLHRRYSSSNSDWMIDIAKEQMDFYYQLYKMPDEQDLRDMLTDITDLGFELDLISFGYVNYRFPEDYWDREIGSTKFGSANKFVCAIHLLANEKSTKMDIRNSAPSKAKINKSREEINNFMKRMNLGFNLKAEVEYFRAMGEDEMIYPKDDGVVIILQNKN